jgi:hypothetical protein
MCLAPSTRWRLLSGSVNHYTFISSLSVYADSSQPGIAKTVW